ncbi:SAVMC3_10250 family protein [Streptomyces desertarenae]|uniref:SAVMC3_10250 family protein n=1 Tax=Streptomyces desertarenae TaxID=2666184 RepID=A0ABW4PF34_9ACTN
MSATSGGSVRELVYLSDNKLKQFVPGRRRWGRTGRRLNRFRLDANTPVGGGGIEFDLGGEPAPAAAAVRDLDAVVGYIEEHALWYQDPDARAGRWVYFEAPLHFFRVGSRDPGIGTVLFLDSPVSDGYAPGPCRLLLHGNDRHLLAPLPSTGLTLKDVAGSAFTAPGVRRTAGVGQPPAADRIDAAPEPMLPPAPAPPPFVVSKVIERADFLPPAGAAWMRGYARVTTLLEARGATVTVATPLYVEYAHDLPD